ncbi:hypothetical protein FACS18942_00540 [Planctomycetales bacterium]|nr:hypothetical protein FACS18942_00540 [Planctomycetales bacterium]
MTHELILTSVTKGLEDSRGFCAVACDKNIPASLVKRLYAISSYRYLFPPDSPDAQNNPVVYSHFIVHTLDTTWSILSRIAPTGWDFDHNPNHLTHHIALAEDERSKEGPVWLLGLAGFHLTEWYTPPVRFNTGRYIPSLTAPEPLNRRQQIAREHSWFDDKKMRLRTSSLETPELLAKRRKENESQLFINSPASCPCPLWKEITGDAAWGGVLAETIRTGQHAAVIYNAGTNILPLFAEALSLLPGEYLWRATFTTCFTGLPEHIVCQWKGAVAGSKEAENLSQQSDILLIDLTKPIKAEPKGIYVDYARSGNDNLLPEPGIENDLDGPDFDTKPFIIADGGDTNNEKEFNPEETPREFSPVQEIGEIVSSPFAPVQSSPAQQPEIVIRTHPKRSKGVFSPLLNMQSRSQFYIIYTIAFALICLLLFFVLNQYFNFGLFSGTNTGQQSERRTVKEQNKENKLADNPVRQKEQVQEKRIEEKPVQPVQETEKKDSGEQKNEKTPKHSEQIKKKRDEIEKKTEEQKTALKPMLDGSSETEFSMPQFLPLLPPSLKETATENIDIIPPKTPQVFSELKPLFPYRAALQINFVPLLTLPKITVVTEKQKFYVEDKDGDILDGIPDEERIPDISRAEWLVSSVNTDNSQATPLFLIKMLEDGLSIEWKRDGLETQHFYNTLWTSLAFVQCSVEGSDETVKSSQLFKPLETQPFYPNKEFDGQDKTEFTVSTPFAEEPWKTLWSESPAPPFSLILDAKILPDLENQPLPGVKAFKKDEKSLPFKFFVDIQTDVDYKKESKKGTAGETQNTSFIPIDIPLEGAAASPAKIVWADRCKDLLKQLNEEKEEKNKTFEEKKKELDAVKQQILSGVSKLPKEEAAALRTKRNDLQNVIDELKVRSGEIDDILKKLPEAQKRVLDNTDLRIEYSLKMTRTDSSEPALLLIICPIKQ